MADSENRVVYDKLLTAKEVVSIVFQNKITYRRLLAYADKGEINCTRVGHVYLFSEMEVRKWLQKRLSSPAWRDKKL